MESNKKIKILPNGPYEVSSDIPLKQNIIQADSKGTSSEWSEGKTYLIEDETPYHLCRCGRSKTKPFCDGAHEINGFDGEEVSGNKPYKKAAVRYKGKRADLLDNENLCAVARFCDRGAGIWSLIEEYDDDASLKMAVEEACDCPAGRLTVVDKQGNTIEPKLKQEIGIIQDPVKKCRGPLWVKGGIQIEGSDGTQYEVRNRATLCRCGESRNMPFCDATHINCPHMKGSDD